MTIEVTSQKRTKVLQQKLNPQQRTYVWHRLQGRSLHHAWIDTCSTRSLPLTKRPSQWQANGFAPLIIDTGTDTATACSAERHMDHLSVNMMRSNRVRWDRGVKPKGATHQHGLINVYSPDPLSNALYQLKRRLSRTYFSYGLWAGLNLDYVESRYIPPPCAIKQKAKEYWHRHKEYRTAEVLYTNELKGIWRKSLSYTSWTSVTKVGAIFGEKEQCFSIVIFTHDPMGFWSALKCKQWKGPQPHIAKYHVQQCLRMSQHYKQLCRNKTSWSTSGKTTRYPVFNLTTLNQRTVRLT